MERRELRKIERTFLINPELDINDYPQLDEITRAMQNMESFAFDYKTNGFLCYAYARNHNDNWFVDIYCSYENDNRKIVEERYIIAPGYQMSEMEERKFLSLVNCRSVLYNDRVCGSLVQEVKSLAPELNLREYEDFGKVLLHIYFSSFQSGLRELLFKAGGMEHIAANLHCIDEWDIFSKNVKEAFGIPITMLRKANSENMVTNWLKEKESRQVVAAVYERFHPILNDFDIMNEYQIQYLKECLELDEKADKKKLRFLEEFSVLLQKDEESSVDYYATYNALMDYQRLCGMVNKKSKIFPSYKELIKDGIDKIWEMYDLIRFYVEEEQRVNQEMYQISRELEAQYAYEDGNYKIVVPKSIRDVLEEAENQRNCLYTYVKDLLDRKTTVLFVRTKENPTKSFVTVEIRDNQIEQAKQRFNEDITFEQSRFLKKFVLSKKIGRY